MVPRMKSALMLMSVLAVGLPAFGQDKGKAVTNVRDAGPDFQFCGDYVGKIEVGPGNRQEIGLQVVPLGEGKFYALQYVGGLPGETKSASAQVALQGVRKGGNVLLEGWPMSITLSRGVATVHYTGGDIVGELLKIRRASPRIGACAPSGATVLFDGKNTDQWTKGKISPEGHLMAGTETKKSYRNFTLHLEYRVPYVESARGQGRGNSGVYLQRRYEVQILDSFGLPILKNGAAALYRLRAPDINASLPPLEWQTYDIEFQAAEFDETGRKTKDARITVCHNGYIVHDDIEILRKTGAGRNEGPEAGPILLQDHGNPVAFRNVWIVDHDNQCDPCDPCCQPKCDPCAEKADCNSTGKCRKPASSVAKEDRTNGDCDCGHHHVAHRH